MACETPLREQHEQAGAALGEWFGCRLPERFADTAEEYRYARETVALVDQNYRAFLYFSGPDTERYLNAMLTNDAKNLAPGRGVPALVLNPQGRILAELDCYRFEDKYLVVSYARVRETLVEHFDRFIIMDDVTLDDATDEFGALALEGPATPQVLAAVGAPSFDSLEEFSHAEATVGGAACRVVRRSVGGVPGAEFIVARADLAQLWQTLREAVGSAGGGPVGYAALNVLRLEAGIPWFGYDFDEHVIPHEAAVETTHISFTKGCYPGQEIVERVRSRGRVNRRRAGLAFSGDAVPAAGEKLLSDGKEAGHVTRAGFSYALGRPIGMGYLRREYLAPGTKLEWSGGAAEVIELPLVPAKTR